MTTPNDNYNILPFYEAESFQNHRKEYAYGQVFPLICSVFNFLPFQIYVPDQPASDYRFTLRELDTGQTVNVTPQMDSTLLVQQTNAVPGFDKLTYPGVMKLSGLNLAEGRYQLELFYGEINTIGGKATTMVSEIFTMVRDVSRFVKLVYWNQTALHYSGGRQIDYVFPYRNYCYLSTDIGKPEYPFTEEVTERDGRKFIEKQISEKVFRFEFAAPEFLCDALRLVRMHDHVRIFHNGQVYDVEDIILTPEWQEQGDVAIVQVQFECDTVTKKIGSGEIQNNLGDFNSDYNNDFFK